MSRRKIYYDVGFETGLLHVSVVGVRQEHYGHVITLELRETRGAYKKGEYIETVPNYVVYKTPKSRKYPYHQMVRSLSLDEIRTAINTTSVKKERPAKKEAP